MGLDIASFLNHVVFLFNGVPVITLDCSIAETHERESEPTSFEIENGQTISDHVVLKPFGLKINGVISDSPLFGAGSIAAAAATTVLTKLAPNPGVLGAKAAAIAALPLFPNPFSPSMNGYEQLLQVQAARFPLTVVTSLHIYPNMWIKKLTAPRDSKSGGALVFTVDMVQLLLVTPVTVNIAQFAAADIAAGAADKGAQEAGALSEAAAAAAKAEAAGEAVFLGGGG